MRKAGLEGRVGNFTRELLREEVGWSTCDHATLRQRYRSRPRSARSQIWRKDCGLVVVHASLSLLGERGLTAQCHVLRTADTEVNEQLRHIPGLTAYQGSDESDERGATHRTHTCLPVTVIEDGRSSVTLGIDFFTNHTMVRSNAATM